MNENTIESQDDFTEQPAPEFTEEVEVQPIENDIHDTEQPSVEYNPLDDKENPDWSIEDIPLDAEGEYDFSGMDDAQLDYIIKAIDDMGTEDEDEDGEPIDTFELPEKFNSNQDLLNSYKMLESKMGNFVKAPEQYEIEGVDMSSPLMSELAGTARELNMSNQAFTAIVNKHAEVTEQLADAAITQEMTALGPNAEARINNINNYVTQNMSEHQAEVLQNMATTAENVAVIEQLIQQSRPSAPTQSAPTPMSDDPQEMLWAEDKYGNNRMETDPQYAKMVNQRMKAFYG